MIFKLLVSLEKLSYGTPSVKEFEVGMQNAKAAFLAMLRLEVNFGKKSFAGFNIRL